MLGHLLTLLQLGAAIPLDQGWELQGPTTRIEAYRGTTAIRSRDGRAFRRDTRLQDGTIEFDVEFVPWRTFVYLQFRMESDTEFEEIYFRPHKSGLPDALQYNPVWHDDSFWQLWHGPGGTAAPLLRHREWVHVRLELQGERAAVFVDSGRTPVMNIRLARTPRSGYLAFRALNAQPDLPAAEAVATIANVRVRSGQSGWDFGAPLPPPTFAPGTITRWQLSPAFAGDTSAVISVPAASSGERAQWPTYAVEPGGVLVIGRHLVRPRPQGRAVARLALRSAGARAQRLQLGYSDRVTVFVNGTPLFAGDSRYSFDRPRQDGVIGLHQATIWLPLRDGLNEVLLVVTDGFGGWGLQGRLDPRDGAELLGS